MSGTTKFTLAFLLLGLAGVGYANVKTNPCVDECTWMAAQVAGCSGMDIDCACTTSLFQSSFRQCVERSCSFADASEGTQFFENACALHHRVNTPEPVLVDESDYYGPDSIEDVRHGHAYHGHRHGHMHHARAEKAADATETQTEATTPAPTRSEPAGRIDAASSAASSETSSAASAGPTTTASESSSSEATSHATSSHSGTTSAHTGSSSQATTTESSKSPSATHTGATTSETPKATSNTSPAATEHSSAATEPTAEPTSNTVVATVPPTVSASAIAASGTTLVVGGSASLSSGLGATGVSINPSVVTPTLPSGHFDPAPSSSGAEVVKPLVNFGAMAWVAIAGIAGGALVL